MSEMKAGAAMQMQLSSWRGYSAYEIAVQHGFEGTEAQWLESLQGRPGTDADMLTVNNRSAVDGNITVRGTDIYVQAGMGTTVAQALEKRLKTEDVADTLESTDATKALSAAQGHVLHGKVNAKARVTAQPVLLTADGWQAQGDLLEQTAPVPGLTADAEKTSAVVSPPTDREKEEIYAACAVRLKEQKDGEAVFTCLDAPGMDLTAHVLVVFHGGEEG